VIEAGLHARATSPPLPARLPSPGWRARILYRLLPLRRRTVLENLRRAFGHGLAEEDIVRLAQSFYAHTARSLVEWVQVPFRSRAGQERLVRVENKEAILRAAKRGKGVLVLAGHLGNWELAPAIGIRNFPEYGGRFHIVRRAIRWRWIEKLAIGRFLGAGLEVIPKSASLDRILDALAAGDAVVFILDQYASTREGVRVEFFGEPVSTHRSLAVMALATGAPVVPVACWREPDGRHVVRFEEEIPLSEREDAGEAIAANTRAYNVALERMIVRHPEQWFWMHRRWKGRRGRPRKEP
jgi:KDO2-lipid IV(A) lauroyltransferase